MHAAVLWVRASTKVSLFCGLDSRFRCISSKLWGVVQDFKKPGAMGDGSFFGLTDGFTSVANGYPGGVFDPMGMAKGDMKEMQTKEIKNGRLAMLSCVGYVAQYQATGKGPIDNLFDHLSSPGFVRRLSSRCLSHCMCLPPQLCTCLHC